jgi:hypothetical protein
MATALDVFMKANGPLAMTQEELDNLGSEGVKMAQKVNAINDAKRTDAQWRQELEQLNVRFPMPSVDEAEAKVSGIKSQIAATVKEYKGEIADCRETLKEKYLTRLEVTHVEQRIEVLSGELADFQHQSDLKLRLAKGQLDSAREFAHLRPRWIELKDRAKAIEKALSDQD